MQIKPGVSLLGLQPQLVVALLAAQEVYRKQSAMAVLTSAVDAKHGTRSLHYKGLAIDLRISNLSDPAKAAQDLKDALSDEFDVLLETDHIHVEWDPAKGVNQ